MQDQKLRRWLSNIPKAELNKPLAIADGKPVTPLDLAREIEDGTALGRKALLATKKIAERHSPITPDEYKLVEERLKLMPSKIKLVTLAEPPKRELSKEEILEELKKKSPLGEEIAKRELRYLKFITTGR